MGDIMTLANYLENKFKGLDLKAVAVVLNMDYKEIEPIINGQELPNFYFVIKIMYYFNLNNDERLELFSLVAESLGISPEKVYNGVIEELSLMSSQNNIML